MELDDIIASQRVDQGNANIVQNIGENADKYAQDLGKANALGVSVETYRQNVNEYNARITQEAIDLASAGPVMQEFFADRERQALIANEPDEYERLGYLEGTFAAFKDGMDIFDANSVQSDLERRAERVLDPVNAVMSDMANDEMDEDTKAKMTEVFRSRYFNSMQRDELREMGKQANELALMVQRPTRVKAPKVLEKISNAKGWQEIRDAFLEDPFAVLGYTGGSSIGQQWLPLLASVPAYALGAPIGAGVAAFGGGQMEYQASLREYAQEQLGYDFTDAKQIMAFMNNPEHLAAADKFASARQQGVVFWDYIAGLVAPFNPQILTTGRALSRQIGRAMTGRSVVPLKRTRIANAVSAIGAKNSYLNKIDTILSQATVGGVLGAAGEYTAQQNAGQETNWGDVFLEAVGEFFTMPVEAGFAHLGVAMNHIKQQQRAAIASKVPAVIEGLAKVAATSTLRTRSPEEFKATVQKMAGDGSLQEVYVKPGDLSQSARQAIASISPEVAQAMEKAEAEGGVATIPMADLLTALTNDEATIKELSQHVRVKQDGMSAVEATKWMKDNEGFLQRHFQEVYRAQVAKKEFREELKSALAPMSEQLKQAHRETIAKRYIADGMSEEEAIKESDNVTRKAMRLFEMQTAHFAAMSGMTPAQFVQRYPNQVQFMLDSMQMAIASDFDQQMSTVVPGEATVLAGNRPDTRYQPEWLDLANIRRVAPEYVGKMLTKLESIEGLKSRIAQGKTEEEKVEIAIEAMKDNLRWLWNFMPEELRERAKLWYVGGRKFVEKMAHDYGISDMQAAAVIAVFSPQRDWFSNLTLAQRLCDMFYGTARNEVADKATIAAAKTFVDKKLASLKEYKQALVSAELAESKKAYQKKMLLESNREKSKAKFEELIAKATNVEDRKKLRAKKKAKDEEYVARINALKESAKPYSSKKSTYERTKRDYDAQVAAFNEIKQGKTFQQLVDEGNDFAAGMMFRAYNDAHNPSAYNVMTPEGLSGGPVTAASGEEKTSGFPGFGVISRAVSVLRDGSPENVYNALGSMHKVRSFYNNLYDPNNPHSVTIDTHATAAALLLPLAASDTYVNDNFSGVKTTAGFNGTYPIYNEAYVQLADELSKKTGKTVLPREVQSVTWEVVRVFFSANFKDDEGNKKFIQNIWKKFDAGKLTLDQAREAIKEKALAFNGGEMRYAWQNVAKPESMDTVVAGDTYDRSNVVIDNRGIGDVRAHMTFEAEGDVTAFAKTLDHYRQIVGGVTKSMISEPKITKSAQGNVVSVSVSNNADVVRVARLLCAAMGVESCDVTSTEPFEGAQNVRNFIGILPLGLSDKQAQDVVSAVYSKLNRHAYLQDGILVCEAQDGDSEKAVFETVKAATNSDIGWSVVDQFTKKVEGTDYASLRNSRGTRSGYGSDNSPNVGALQWLNKDEEQHRAIAEELRRIGPRNFVSLFGSDRLARIKGQQRAAWWGRANGQSYRSRSGLSGVDGLPVTWVPDDDLRRVYELNGMACPDFIELPQTQESAEAFAKAISASKENNPHAAAVYVYPVEEYAQMRLFLSADHSCGVAVKENGDIVSVFNTGKTHKGVVHALLTLAIKVGGNHLDCFDTVLPRLYAVHGFRVVVRQSWNEDYKPDGWNKDTFRSFNNGEPGVTYMSLDDSYFGDYQNTDGLIVDDYDETIKLHNEATEYLTLANAARYEDLRTRNARQLGASQTQSKGRSTAQSEELSQLIGQSGAKQLGKRKLSLVGAKVLRTLGVGSAYIHALTNWSVGKDGKWRTEIEDVPLAINLLDKPNGYTVKLGDVLSGSELFKAYPGLDELTVTVIDNPKSTIAGALNPNGFTINIDQIKKQVDKHPEKGPYQRELHKTIVHELQHVIQVLENFALGGSSSDQESQFLILMKYIGFTKKSIALGLAREDLIAILTTNVPDDVKSRIDWVLANTNSKSVEEFVYKYHPYSRYERLAGEVEARNAETRLDISWDERYLYPIEYTEDVPRQNQLFAEDGYSDIVQFEGETLEDDSQELNQEVRNETNDQRLHRLFMQWVRAVEAHEHLRNINSEIDYINKNIKVIEEEKVTSIAAIPNAMFKRFGLGGDSWFANEYVRKLKEENKGKRVTLAMVLDEARKHVAELEAMRDRQQEIVNQIGDETQLARLRQQYVDAQRELGQQAWHGSPHIFDEFSTDFIGTGEGAQVHGWGLYFAKSKRIASERYRDRLTVALNGGDQWENFIDTMDLDTFDMGIMSTQFADGLRDMLQSAVILLDNMDANDFFLQWSLDETEVFFGPIEAIMAETGYTEEEVRHNFMTAKQFANKYLTHSRQYYAEMVEVYDILQDSQSSLDAQSQLNEKKEEFSDEMRQWLDSKLIPELKEIEENKAPEGRLFKVEIPDDDVLLDEDKTFDEQPEKVKAALEQLSKKLKKPGLFKSKDTGSEMYRKLRSVLRSAKDASLALNSVGIKGITYEGGIDGRCFVIFDDKAIQIIEYMQNQEESRRASYNPSEGITRLFKAADESSFVHETGHYWLETMASLAREILSRDNADRMPGEQAIIDTLDGFLKCLGQPGDTAEERIQGWLSAPLDARRGMHEQFARGYEAYLRRGKAPTSGLRKVFEAFTAWLKRIYADAMELDVEMTDEVAALYDRLFMAEAEAESVKQDQHIISIFPTARAAGMSDEDFAKLQEEYKAVQNAIEASIRANREKNHRLLRSRFEREKRNLQSEYEKLLNKHRKALEKDPVYVAWKVLTEPFEEGGVTFYNKLSLAEVRRTANEDTAIVDAIQAKGLITNIAQRFIPIQVLSDMVGAKNAQELLIGLADALPLEEEAIERAEAEFMQNYGNLPDDDGIGRSALIALAAHDPAFSNVLEKEYNALAKLTGGKKLVNEGARLYATKQVGEVPVKNLMPLAHARAEARAGQDAQKAFNDGDLVSAAIHKRNQVVQHHIARAGYEARAEIAKGLTYVKKVLKSKTIWGSYMEQIENLAARFELAKIEYNNQAKDLEKFIEEEEIGTEFDDFITNRKNPHFQVSYRELSVDEFREVIDTIKALEKLGRDKDTVIKDGQRQKIAEVVSEINESIAKNAKDQGRTLKQQWEKNRPSEQRLQGIIRFLYQHTKIAAFARVMDGDTYGALWNTLIKRANQCGDKETEMRSKLTHVMQQILGPVIAMGGMHTDTVVLPKANRTLTRQERIAFALNWGNEGNRQRLKDGFDIGDQEAEVILRSLTEAEWRAVEQIWQVFETLRPQMEALEIRLYGRAPRWVEYGPFEVTTKEGRVITVSGGYYPAVYDTDANERSQKHQDMKAAEGLMKSAARAVATDRSHMKKRSAKVDRPLSLRLSNAFDALNNEVHDICWREFVIDTQKIMNNGVADAIAGYYDPDVRRQFRNWLADIAMGDQRPKEGCEGWLSHIRQGVGLAGLGFNVVSALSQLTGLATSATRLGNYVGVGVSQYARNPVGMTREVCEVSLFMKNRGLTRFRELNEVNALIRSADNKVEQYMDKMRGAGYLMLLKVQQVVDTVTWLGAYQQAIDNGETVEQARAMADQVVIDTQGSGMIKDLSAIEREHWLKIFTVFYSFMNNAFNLNVTALFGDRNRYRAAAKILTMSVVMPTLEAMLRAALPVVVGDDDDEDDKTAKMMKAASDTIGFNLGLFVGVRELQGLANAVSGGPIWNYSGPSGLRLLNDFTKATQQVVQWEFDAALAKSLVNLGGSLFGLPAAQINRAIATAVAYDEGDIEGIDEVAQGILFGVSMKK